MEKCGKLEATVRSARMRRSTACQRAPSAIRMDGRPVKTRRSELFESRAVTSTDDLFFLRKTEMVKYKIRWLEDGEEDDEVFDSYQ